MSTNATISYVTRDKDSNVIQIQSVYLHWDGYPEYAFNVLKEHYTDPKKIQALMDLGSLSVLDKNVDCPKGHSFNTPIDNYCIAYHRDRGEDLTISVYSTIEALKEYVKGMPCYNYIYDGEWKQLV